MDNPNIRDTKVWRRKQVQEDQAHKKVLAIMISGFVREKFYDELIGTLDDDINQDDRAEELGNTLF